MRKLVLAALCWYPMLGLAGDYACVHLKVKIKNQTQSACHLIGLKMDSGQINYLNINDLPLLIPVGHVSDSLTVSENLEHIDFSLTYECGENKTIKLNMTKGLCVRNAIVNGSILSVIGLDAKLDASNGLYWDNKVGEAVWTLTEAS